MTNWVTVYTKGSSKQKLEVKQFKLWMESGRR